jgi:hypothetical protein
MGADLTDLLDHGTRMGADLTDELDHGTRMARLSRITWFSRTRMAADLTDELDHGTRIRADFMDHLDHKTRMARISRIGCITGRGWRGFHGSLGLQDADNRGSPRITLDHRTRMAADHSDQRRGAQLQLKASRGAHR